MKCPRCSEEMYSTISGGSDSVRGNYTETKHICPKCHYEVSDNFNDLVYRAPFFKPDYSVTNYGWICPKCGAVLSPSIQECPYCTPYKVTCGPDSVSSIKSVPLGNDITSQAQVYSPQTLRDNITVTGSCDSTSNGVNK
jgi:hypothetical protein